MPEKQFLTTGEIADYCGVNFRTVIRWIGRGFLKSHQLPGRGDNRIDVADFLNFLRTYKMPVPKEFLKSARRILIVEDDLSMANAMQRVLRRGGFETAIASNGFRAGMMIHAYTPVLVTLDLKMPGLSGHDVLKLIRSTEHLARIKILVVSAMPRKELHEALESGADAILEKPFQNEELVGKISKLLGLSEADERLKERVMAR